MDSAKEKVIVRATPEECYSVVIDFASYPEWASDIKSVNISKMDADGRATEVTFRAGAFGRSTSYTLGYNHNEAPGSISWKQVGGDITSRLDGRYRFVQLDDTQTEVEYELDAELLVPIPGFIKRRAESKIVHSALEDLRSRVEGVAAHHG
ncbi:MAG: hypothetical protein HKL82_05970 [Acidimicrobiaceae bacterium]|nr:hypothetical protein [Acidimicrobiaceae bacterium]